MNERFHTENGWIKNEHDGVASPVGIVSCEPIASQSQCVFVDISPELLLSMAQNKMAGVVQEVVAVQDPVPPDAEIHSIAISPSGRELRVYLTNTQNRQYTPLLDSRRAVVDPFWLFAGLWYEPSGGLFDCKGRFETQYSAMAFVTQAKANNHRDFDWWHLVDAVAGDIVARCERGGPVEHFNNVAK